MADFFKYVGKADRGIQDWSKIGKDISDGLKEVTDKRQAERARIDKLTSDAKAWWYSKVPQGKPYPQLSP